MKELNYPVKYAVLEVKENGEYLDNIEEEVKGFVVSKCYVVRSIVNYLDDGKLDIVHEVVFPYKDITYFRKKAFYGGLGYRNMPLYDVSGEPYPVNRVHMLYNTFDEAKREANLKNGERLVKMTSKLYDDREELDSKSKQYLYNMAICNEFENAILWETKDMVVDGTILTNKEDKEQILNLNRR